jgi:hypothetical protein
MEQEPSIYSINNLRRGIRYKNYSEVIVDFIHLIQIMRM